MSSIKPDKGGSKINSPEECCSSFVVSSCNASELLKCGEEVFNQVSGFIQCLIVYTLHFSVFPWGYHGLHTGAFQQVQHPFLRIVGFVSQSGLQTCEQSGQ